MIVIMGGTGHVGSAVAETLLSRGEQVTIIARDSRGTEALQAKGARFAQADVNHVDSLRAALQRGRRAFLLNPPADTRLDTDAVERSTVANILAALDGSGLEKVVAASAMGAQPGERLGDLGVLWELEQGLQRQAIPAAINRAGYYMSNWDLLLDQALKTGTLPTMLPADLPLPMVAPQDLGVAAADRLTSSIADSGIRHVEGPARYSPADVAAALANALQRPVALAVTPREQWIDAYLRLGFSSSAAESYARMTAVSVDGGFDSADEAIRGSTSLNAYIRELVARSAAR